MISVASTTIVFAEYNASVMTATENATPNAVGMNSHATDSRIPCRNLKPSTSPAHMMTAVVTTIRIASAASLDSRPDARCTGRTHNRDSKPSVRSRMRPIPPTVAPVMAPTIATSGTLP